MEPIRPNGAFVIVLNDKDEVLMVRSAYGKQKWSLPGGGLDRGETPRHAAVEEVLEESGIILEEEDLLLIAIFAQRLVRHGVAQSYGGLMLLFLSQKPYIGDPPPVPQEEGCEPEILEQRFMPIRDIIELYLREKSVELGSVRPLIHFTHYQRGLRTAGFEARLSDQVVYLENQTLI